MKLDIKKIEYTTEKRQTDGRIVERPILHLFCRNEEKEPVHLKLSDGSLFDPYIFIRKEDWEEFKGTEEYYKVEDRIVEVEEADKPDIFEEEYVKVKTAVPGDVPKIRRVVDSHEADIPFSQRFKIDKKIREGLELEED